jgi:peptide chain release factor 2
VARLSVAEAGRGLADIYARLARLHAAANVDGMRAELAALDNKAARPGFWEEAFGSSGALVRRHRLAVEIQRLDDLRQRADLVREMIDASIAEAEDALAEELVAAFVRLERRLRKAERELVFFDDVDRGDALLTIRPVGGKDGGAAWAETLAKMYAAWATERSYDVELKAILGGQQEVRVLGPYAYGYLKGEHGGHRLIDAPRERDAERGETYLARVEVRALAAGAPPLPKTTDDEPPIRTYDQWRARGVRDRRTGWSEGDPKRVLAGRIDGFLDAQLTSSAEPTTIASTS